MLGGQATAAADTGPIEAALGAVAAAVEASLHDLLPVPAGAQARVAHAMRYATMGGGKRIRPFLVLAGARLLDVPEGGALRVAAAIEMVHCYSLVHDDLPAMDNSELRRGRPTVHREFDDATAILAGDGLLTLAFEVLADPRTHRDAAVRANLALALARAAGAAGMVGGQMIDLEAEHKRLDVAAITQLQRLKTGAIFGFACGAGAILGSAPPTVRRALARYAEDIGLAFQIVDDLLDAQGSAAAIGKPVGQDRVSGKATFVSLLGADRARAEAKRLARSARHRLDGFGAAADPLRAMASFIVSRQR